MNSYVRGFHLGTNSLLGSVSNLSFSQENEKEKRKKIE